MISTQTLECEDVEYLGHKDGSIVVPPLVIQDHVFIAENALRDRDIDDRDVLTGFDLKADVIQDGVTGSTNRNGATHPC